MQLRIRVLRILAIALVAFFAAGMPVTCSVQQDKPATQPKRRLS